MSREYYFKRCKELEDTDVIKVEKFNEAKESDDCIVYKRNHIKIESADNERLANHVAGFISVADEEYRFENLKENQILASIDNETAIRREKGFRNKIVGYVGINGKTYALTVKKHSSTIIILITLAVIGLGVGFIVATQKSPVEEVLPAEPTEEIEETLPEDEKGTGTLDGEELEYSSEGFRFKINSTPIISEGKMNVRIESPAAENSEFVAVYDYFINAKVDASGKVIEKYDTPVNIYTSPEIYGDENLENGTIKTTVEEGYYTGVCYCSVYDLNGNFIMTNGTVLSVYCAD